MHARRLLAATAVIALSIGLFAGPSGAAATLTAAVTSVSGNTATVSGAVEFDPITEAVNVGGSPTTGTPAADPAHQNAGTFLESGTILPIDNGLRFIWKVSDVPEQVPPEGVRYTWAFTIGQQSFQLQAKRTNVASVTTGEDPEGHALKLVEGGDWFQLRGACQVNYLIEQNPVSGCYHLAFLNGGFDAEANTVHMDMPFETRDRIGRLVAPEFVPGAQLVAQETAGMSIAASFQAVVTNAPVSRFINGWTTFYTAPAVALAVGTAGGAPASQAYNTPVELNEDGTFTGSVSGLTSTGSAPKNHVFVRACYGTTCVYEKLPATA